MASPAPCLKKFLADATAQWRNRNRASDGIMADAAHLARKSDHNTGDAADLTHDPINGPDGRIISRQLVGDPRIKYIIFAGEIWKARTWKWEPYRGSNPHHKHVHVSIKPEARNDLKPWPWSPDKPETHPLNLPVLRLTFPIVKRESVMKLQERLKAHGADINPDGMFGLKTQRALVQFQRAQGITDDGICGPFTWKALLAE